MPRAGAVGEGAEVGGAVGLAAMHFQEARIRFVREFEVRVLLVVVEAHVEAWPVQLDERLFEKKGFLLGAHRDEVDVAGLLHERDSLG